MNDNAKYLWRFYKKAKSGQSTVVRAGYGVYGVYDFDLSQPFDFTRSESDLEHVAGTAYLVLLLSVFYPKIVPIDELNRYYTWALLHELGEIDAGDTQDDGTRDEEKKDREERIALEKMLVDIPAENRENLLAIFDEFQAKETVFGKTTFFIDKLEAILNGFIYEFQGRGGSFANKRSKIDQLSTSDLLNMTLTKSELIPDMWGCNLILRAKRYDFPYLDEFIEIMQAASLDVRGEKLSWISKAKSYQFIPSNL